jgi:hypothetical protein
LKVKIYKTIVLPVAAYGCETCSLTLREEHRLRVLENRMPRRIFGPKRDEVMDSGENCTVGSFIVFTHHQIFLDRPIKENEVGGACVTHGQGEKCIQGFGEKA